MNRFLMVDDHEIVRNGLKVVIKELYPSSYIAEAGNEATAMSILKHESFDIVILDIQLPDSDSFRLTEYIRKHLKPTRILIYSMAQESLYARRMVRSGASGYIFKGSSLLDLKTAIETVLNGRVYLSREIIEQLASDAGQSVNKNPFETLSAREFEVANLLMREKSLTNIAGVLGIGISTAATHKSRLFEKLQIKSTSELIKLAQLYGNGQWI